jgi:uncharacterized protein (TIGR02246 family)
MNTLSKLVLPAAVVLAMGACSKSVTDSSADESAVQNVQHAWYKAYNAGDGAGVAALYTDDAVVMAPDVPAARGMSAIRDYYSKSIADFKTAGLTAVEGANSNIGVSGDLAWQEYTYTVTDNSGAAVEVGKSLTVFQRKDGGKWMIVRDTWNRDAAKTGGATPAPQAPAAPK